MGQGTARTQHKDQGAGGFGASKFGSDRDWGAARNTDNKFGGGGDSGGFGGGRDSGRGGYGGDYSTTSGGDGYGDFLLHFATDELDWNRQC